MALRAGGRWAATWSALNPLHEIPIMPTLPVHQGWAAIQAMISHASACSWGRYSSSRIPSDSPVPRMSARTQAKPWPAMYGRWRESRTAVPSFRRYGRNSKMAGTGRSAASSGSQIRAARRVPSAIVTHSVSMVRTLRGNSVTTRIGAFNPTGATRSPVGGKSPPGDPPSSGVAGEAGHGHSGVHPHARRDGGASLTCARLAGRPPPGGRGGEDAGCGRSGVGAGGGEQLAKAVELLAGALVHAVQGDLELEAERLEQRLGAVLEREGEREVLATGPLAQDAEPPRRKVTAGRCAEDEQPLAGPLGIGGRVGDQGADDAREPAVDICRGALDQAREHQLGHAPNGRPALRPANPPYWGDAGDSQGDDDPPPTPTVVPRSTVTIVVERGSCAESASANASPKPMPIPKITTQPRIRRKCSCAHAAAARHSAPATVPDPAWRPFTLEAG